MVSRVVLKGGEKNLRSFSGQAATWQTLGSKAKLCWSTLGRIDSSSRPAVCSAGLGGSRTRQKELDLLCSRLSDQIQPVSEPMSILRPRTTACKFDQFPSPAVNMDAIRLREAVVEDVEAMARVAIAAFADDPLVDLFWPPSFRIGREEVAIEERVAMYYTLVTEGMEMEGHKFVVAMQGDEVLGWAEWKLTATAKTGDDVDSSDNVPGHMAGALEANEPGSSFFLFISRRFTPIYSYPKAVPASFLINLVALKFIIIRDQSLIPRRN